MRKSRAPIARRSPEKIGMSHRIAANARRAAIKAAPLVAAVAADVVEIAVRVAKNATSPLVPLRDTHQ